MPLRRPLARSASAAGFPRASRILLLLLLGAVVAGLAACAAPGPPAPDGGTLTYRGGEARSVSYRMGDTATVTVDGAGGASFGLSVRASGLLQMEMTPGRRDSTRVSVRFREFHGTMSSPMAGTVEAGESEIRGALVFTMGPRGGTRIEKKPELSGQVGQFLNPEGLARELLPRLPERVSGTGGTWRDSLSYSTGGEGPRTDATVVRSYTLAGDTIVGGRRLLELTYEGTVRYRVEGTRMGMEMEQTLEGPVRGTVHWDPVAGLPVWSRSTKELTGSMEIPAVGAPAMGLDLESTTVLRLEPAAGSSRTP